MGVIEWRLSRMVEVKLVQGKTQTVKTVLPVTVREARREQTNLALVARAGTLAAYTILLLGLLAVLATLCNYRNTRIENRKLQTEVRKLEEKKAVLERCSRYWLRREQLAEAINFVESDFAPFLGTGKWRRRKRRRRRPPGSSSSLPLWSSGWTSFEWWMNLIQRFTTTQRSLKILERLKRQRS